MRWRKMGLVFSPSQGAPWMRTHAQVPTPLLCDGFIRVYFASRPERTLSLVSYVDLDAVDPSRVLMVCQKPILQLGQPGAFDEHGIMPSAAVREGACVYLYYSGWSRGASVPYINSTGLAISEDGGMTFYKVSNGPILSRDRLNPYSATSPAVIRKEGCWDMWFCSGTGWVKVKNKWEPTYDIKHATSTDGINWTTSPSVVITQRDPGEAITRPTVWREGGMWRMIFCFRGSQDFRDGADAYRMGYAESSDGRIWRRKDGLAGLAPSHEGWDSCMVAYPAHLTAGNRTFLFYNGNDFGVQGVGCAEQIG